MTWDIDLDMECLEASKQELTYISIPKLGTTLNPKP